MANKAESNEYKGIIIKKVGVLSKHTVHAHTPNTYTKHTGLQRCYVNVINVLYLGRIFSLKI